jgi:hypothetical protein
MTFKAGVHLWQMPGEGIAIDVVQLKMMCVPTATRKRLSPPPTEFAMALQADQGGLDWLRDMDICSSSGALLRAPQICRNLLLEGDQPQGA